VDEYLYHHSNALEPMYLISNITQKHCFLIISYQQPAIEVKLTSTGVEKHLMF
jgi:hypothetical protein